MPRPRISPMGSFLHVCVKAWATLVWPSRTVKLAILPRRSDVIEAIDVHTHIFARGWPDFAARYGGDRWPRLEGDPSTGCKLYLGATFNRSLTPHAFDPARRVEDMDRTEVATQLLSPAPPTFCYWAPPAAAAEWHRMQNDVIADIVARHPRRFLGAGGLPLQAPDLAVKELERVVRTLRFPAVEIGANVDGRDLDDASADPRRPALPPEQPDPGGGLSSRDGAGHDAGDLRRRAAALARDPLVLRPRGRCVSVYPAPARQGLAGRRCGACRDS